MDATSINLGPAMRVLASDLAQAQGLAEVPGAAAPAESPATPLQQSEGQRLSVGQQVLWLLTAVTAFCAPLLPVVCRVTVGVSVLIWLATLRRTSGWSSVWSRPPLRWLMAFIAWIVVSLMWAPEPAQAWRDVWLLRHLLWALPVTLLIAQRPALGRVVVHWLVAGLAIVAGVSLCGRLALYAGVELPGWLWNPLAGTLRNSYIDMGVYLPLVAFAAVAWGVRQAGVRRAAALSIAALILVDVNFAYSGRIALVSTWVALAIGLCTWPATARVKTLLVLAHVALLIAAMQGSAWTGRSPIRQMALWRADHQQLSSTPIRLEIWRCAINVWLERPVFGGGPGARAAYQDRVCSFANSEQRQLHRLRSAHQQYLDLLAAQGLVGLALFALWMAGVVRGAWQARQSWEGATVLAGLAILLVGSLFNSFLIDLSTRYLWVLLAAVAMAWAPGHRSDRDRAGA